MMLLNGTFFLFLLVSVSSPVLTAMEEDMRAEKDSSQCQIGNGESYRGTVNTTKSGYQCQKWSKQTPRSHSLYTKRNRDGKGLGDHNYCRNPDNEAGVWCYAMKGTRWELCAVPFCGNCYYDLPRLLPKHLLSSHKMVPKLCKEKCGFNQYKYAGVQNHKECWCGNSPPPASKKINQFKCDRACKGDKKQMCGGGYKMNIFKVEPEDVMDVIKKHKKHYLGLENTAKHAKKYFKKARELLPALLSADALDQNEVGVAYEVTHPKQYPLALLTGKNIKTVRHKKQSIDINGKVNKIIGKRSYRLAVYRPTGLYAKPGDIITITIPQELVGKISAKVGHDNGWYIEFPLRKSTQKIGSPWGGLIVIELKDIDATSQQGQFSVQIENAIEAPYFVYGKNTNNEWDNRIKKNAAPWAVFRIPGELQMFIRTEKVNKLTDMEGIMKKWKRTMDLIDELVGIPLNIQPGEEQLHFRADISGGGGRSGSAVCAGGGQMHCGYSYEPDFPRGGFHVAYHEFGHGSCYKNLPNMGGQMTADIVAQYMERTTGRDGLQHMIDDHDYSPKEREYWNFNLLYTMASFAKFSNGKACGEAKFKYGKACDFSNPGGDTCHRSSYTVTSYYECWTDLYQLPLWEFGWDVLRKVFSSAGRSSESYNSKTDRMADLYCKATKKNLIPLFNFYNIKVSKSVAEPCGKQEKPDMITKYINIANCIKNEDIKKCTKLPGFPEHKGICTFNGVCNRSPDYNGKIMMKDQFDLWGGTFNKDFKKGSRGTGQTKDSCLARAREMWRWCRNDLSQRITATFAPSNGKSNSIFTYPAGATQCQIGKGESYDGTVNTTKSGYECQKWSRKKPRSHSVYTKRNRDGYGIGDHNYCRNPDNDKGVWCYATTGTRWELCDVPVCG